MKRVQPKQKWTKSCLFSFSRALHRKLVNRVSAAAVAKFNLKLVSFGSIKYKLSFQAIFFLMVQLRAFFYVGTLQRCSFILFVRQFLSAMFYNYMNKMYSPLELLPLAKLMTSSFLCAFR